MLDDRTVSRIAMRNGPSVQPDVVAQLVEEIRARAARGEVADPEALLAAWLRRREPHAREALAAEVRSEEIRITRQREWRRDLAPMSDAERAASAVAMRECIDRVTAMLETSREIVTHDPHGPMRG